VSRSTSSESERSRGSELEGQDESGALAGGAFVVFGWSRLVYRSALDGFTYDNAQFIIPSIFACYSERHGCVVLAYVAREAWRLGRPMKRVPREVPLPSSRKNKNNNNNNNNKFFFGGQFVAQNARELGEGSRKI